MKVDDFRLSSDGQLAFHLARTAQVPLASGCYFLASLNEDVLYIGQTTCLNRRFREHVTDIRMTAVTPAGRAAWFAFVFVAECDLLSVESQLIFQYQAQEGTLPPLNRAGP